MSSAVTAQPHVEPTAPWRSLYRGFFVLMVDLFRAVVLPTRRCGSR